MDQDEDWQHHQVQCQEETLEEDKAEVVNCRHAVLTIAHASLNF